jgi:hypothetical protein
MADPRWITGEHVSKSAEVTKLLASIRKINEQIEASYIEMGEMLARLKLLTDSSQEFNGLISGILKPRKAYALIAMIDPRRKPHIKCNPHARFFWIVVWPTGLTTDYFTRDDAFAEAKRRWEAGTHIYPMQCSCSPASRIWRCES